MAANGSSRGSLRPHNASRSPSFVIIGLLVVIAIIGFNYWNVSSRNNELRSTVLDMTDRLRLAGVKRLSIEKRNDALAEQMKQSRTEVETSKTQIANKETELLKIKDELDVKSKELQRVQEQDLANCHSALASTKSNSSLLQDSLIRLRDDSSRLQSQIDELNAQRTNGQLCKPELDRSRLELLQRVQQVLGQNSVNLLQQNGVDLTGLSPRPDNRQPVAPLSQGGAAASNNAPLAGAQVGNRAGSIVHVEPSSSPSNSGSRGNSDPGNMKHGLENMQHVQGSVIESQRSGQRSAQRQGGVLLPADNSVSGGAGIHGDGFIKGAQVTVSGGGNVRNEPFLSSAKQAPPVVESAAAAPSGEKNSSRLRQILLPKKKKVPTATLR